MERESTVNKELSGAAYKEGKTWILRLFVTGASPNSIRAIDNLTRICEEHIKGQYEMEVIDVYQEQVSAISEQIIALPLLVKKSPFPQRRLIGDMSDTKKVLRGLGLSNFDE